MAVLFACGYEVGDLDYYTSLANPALNNLTSIEGERVVIVNTVNQGLHRRPDGSGGKFCGFTQQTLGIWPIPTTPRWVHFWFKRRSDATNPPQFLAMTSIGAEQCNVLFDTADNKVKIRRNINVLATSVGTFDPSLGYYVTLEIVVDNTAGLVRVYLNDSPTPFVEVTAADTQFQTSNEFLGVGIGGGTAARLFTDDIVITDAATGRLPESYGVLGRPVSNNSVAFTPTTGTNWQNVRPSSLYNGVDPSAATRYNEALAAGQDLYNILLDSNVAPVSTVPLMATHVLAGATGTLTGQVLVKSGATTANSSSFGFGRGLPFAEHTHYWLTDPNTGLAWSPSALVPGNLSIGLKTL